MNTTSEIPPTKNHPNVTAGIVMRFGQVVVGLVAQAVILFLAAGQLNWTWAWVFLGICLVSVLINGTIMLRTNPETIAERGRPKETKDWTVCRTGPYRFVRHPGYVGTILQSLGIPSLLGSLWALIPGITAAALMIIRTSLEDRMLQSDHFPFSL
jgi:protein-S-isoprenylcysteine O-methyltransferase Ste14